MDRVIEMEIVKECGVEFDFPQAVRMPNKLIFTGAVTAEYNGSAPVTVEIPEGTGNTAGRQNTPITLDTTGEQIVWDYSEGDFAVAVLTEEKPILINNAYDGAVAFLQVYGATLDFSDGTRYRKSATFDYLVPMEGEHIDYALIYHAGKWDVTSMIYAGGGVNE